jgi:hypothetical protein
MLPKEVALEMSTSRQVPFIGQEMSSFQKHFPILELRPMPMCFHDCMLFVFLPF